MLFIYKLPVIIVYRDHITYIEVCLGETTVIMVEYKFNLMIHWSPQTVEISVSRVTDNIILTSKYDYRSSVIMTSSSSLSINSDGVHNSPITCGPTPSRDTSGSQRFQERLNII